MITKKFKFKNGQTVREKITGYAGTITGTCFYLTGCNQYLITAKSKNSTTPARTVWYDEDRLEEITENELLILSKPKEKYVPSSGRGRGADISAPGGKSGDLKP